MWVRDWLVVGEGLGGCGRGTLMKGFSCLWDRLLLAVGEDMAGCERRCCWLWERVWLVVGEVAGESVYIRVGD